MTNLVTFPGLGLSFEVNRVAFTIGGMNIYWYGVLIATGIILAILFAFRHCAEFGIDGDSMTDVIVVGVVMAIVSARAYYVAMSPYGYDSLLDMLDIRQGGLAIYGGIIGAVIFGAMACRWRKIHIPAMLDLTGMGFLIGQCIGRWGNFVNQEAFGCNTTLPWGMYSAATEAYLRGSTVTAPAGAVTAPTTPSVARPSSVVSPAASVPSGRTPRYASWVLAASLAAMIGAVMSLSTASSALHTTQMTTRMMTG